MLSVLKWYMCYTVWLFMCQQKTPQIAVVFHVFWRLDQDNGMMCALSQQVFTVGHRIHKYHTTFKS